MIFLKKILLHYEQILFLSTRRFDIYNDEIGGMINLLQMSILQKSMYCNEIIFKLFSHSIVLYIDNNIQLIT